MYSGITVGAVTLIGNKHKNRQTPCEDYSYAGEACGVTAVIVSDGAGSKQYTHARFGSEAACKSIFDLLTRHFDSLYNENREQAVRSLIIARLHIAFADIMKEMELSSLEQLSCTLMFCAVKDRRMLIGHLGDGLIAKISSSGAVPLTMPQNEKDGTTFFVTAGHAPDYLRLVKTTVDDCHAVALMTDGVQDSVYDETSGLVKPVVAKLCETFSKGREEGEKAIEDTIAKYIVGGSNNSDDASLGVMLFEGTEAPDASKLPGSAASFPSADETFRDVQKTMVEDVKKAHAIISGLASKEQDEAVKEDIRAEEADESAKPKETEAESNASETKEDTAAKEADKSEPAVTSNLNTKLIAALIACGVEFVIIILLLIMLFK